MGKYLYFKLVFGFVLLFSASQVQAQNNWDGDNALGEFILCNNWFGDVCPVTWNATTDLNIQLRNGPQTTMYLNYGGWIDINNLTYFASYTPSVNQFDADGPFGSENGINFYGKIENYSPNHTQVFNLPFHGRNATVIEINPINGGFTFNRPIYNSGNRNFHVYGPNSRKITLNSYPEGNGSVGFYLKQYSIVEVNYNNVASLSGGYFVEEGELWVESNGVIQGGIQVGNGNALVNKLYISNPTTPTTVANNIVVPANSTNATIGSLNTSNTHTYSGTINLNNNTVNFDVVSAGGSVNFTNTISGSGGLRKISPGLVRLSGSNSYTGNTTINAGTLQYGAANAIANTSNVILNGGKFSTGAAVGFSDTVGTLALTDNSTIELGSGNHILTFAASNAVAWTAGRTLTITGWTNSCTGAKIFVGTNNTGLTAGQLAQITFQGYLPGASISTTGELIPGNVTLTATGGTLLGNYNTLSAAFTAINAGTHTGVLVMSVLNDINEGANTATLNHNAAMTSLLIQPDGCAARTITGTGTGSAGTPLIDFSGADFVTIDGLNAGGNSLTISNTSTSNTSGTCTIRFITDASNNHIYRTSILGSATMTAGTNGGNIWFATRGLPTNTGNDNNSVEFCNIGPAGSNLPSKGIYFSGTPGFENNNITIDNNNIYDYFSAAVESAGVYITTGSTLVTITNNKFYQSATRTQTTGVVHSGIKIANASGNGFSIASNTIGYANSSGTGTYNFVGIANSIFTPITLSVASASVQGNTIAGIAHNTSTATFSGVNMFAGINVTAGNVNIGNASGNTIGLPAAPITFNATAGVGGTLCGINMTGTGAVSIQNNTIQSITTTGVAAAAFNFTGINTAGAGVYTITNNTIGHTLAANSINIGALGVTTTASTFTGINSTATGSPLTIGASGASNIIQNITLNAVAANNFNGISTSGAISGNLTNTYNSIRGIRFAAASTTASNFTGIINSGAVTGTINISNNNLGIAGTDLVTYVAGNSGLFRGIVNTGGTAAAALSILSNDFRGIVHTAAATAATSHNLIINSAATLSQDISSNTFTNLNINSTGGIVMLSDGVSLTATGTKNINSNSIVGTFTKSGASGSLTIYNDAASSVSGAVINNNNNNFSNITISGTSTFTGWSNTDGVTPFPTKTINGNTFNTLALASAPVTILNTNAFGGAVSSLSNNIISGVNAGSITGIIIASNGAATTFNATGNSVSNLTSSLAVTGINSSQPAGTATFNLNNNTLSTFSGTGIYGILDATVSTNKSISNNNINSLNGSSLVSAISISAGAAGLINNNTITSISSTGTVAGSIVSGISVTGGSAITISGNAITTLSSANDGSFRGIYVNPLGATSNTITSNTINGMTSTSATTGFSVRAIEVQGTGNANISSNTISNITAPTTNVSTGSGIPIVGIYYGSSGAASTISGNTINSINASAVTAINVQLAGIVTANTAGGGTISKNRIYGLTNTTTGTTNSTIGCQPNGGSWTFANNMISITNNNTVRAIGIFDTGATGARNYYYNSIYIGGTHAGSQVSTAFQFNAAAGTGDIKNNIFMMARTSSGKNYAFVNTSSTFTGITTNYNVLNCSVATTVGLSNATDTTFSAWKTVSGGDANSYTALVIPFADVTTADLHISPICTDIESGGTPVSILDDYDSTARNVTTPDIGADEFSGSRPADITLTPSTSICIGSGTTLTASSTDLTYVYTWSPATGLSATTGASVTATPIVNTTYTVTGTSPASCVKTKDVTITVNALPAPITVAPSSVNICPNTIQTFTAAPNTGTATVGVASGTSVAANTPYRQGTTTEVRVQYLFTKAELNAAGITGGNITSIAFNVTTAGTIAMGTYTISMGHTASTVLTTTYLTPAFTTVFTTVNLLPVLGINTHTFSTPFNWDGTSNVVINICHTGTAGVASTVSISTPPVVSTISRTGGSSCSSLTGTTNANRPVTTFGFELPITWSPTADLYIDAAATTAYNPATHLNQPTIYAKAPAPVVYTATVTTPVTSCTQTSTGTILMSGSTWNGSAWSPAPPTGTTSLTFTGNYSSTGSLSGCSCTVNSGTVVFNSPDALNLNGGLTVNAPGTLKFNDGASLVQTDDSATNSGIITVERLTQPMYRFDFTYWGSPVTLASNFALGGAGGLSPDTLSDKYFSWTPTIANLGGNWANESAATIMDPRKGYCVRAPQTFSFTPATKIAYTANFIGTPNNGIISTPIYHGTMALATNDDKYNLIGNPYPSALDAQMFLTDPANTPIIDGTIYFWTHNSPISSAYSNPFYGTFALNYNSNDYAAWNSLGAVGLRGIQAGSGGAVPNGYIASGQGFFAKSTGTAATGATVTFRNAMRVAGNNNQFFRQSIVAQNERTIQSAASDKNRIWLDLISESGSFSQILVGYLPDATIDYDRSYDGVPIDESGMLLYSIIPERKLVIQGRPMPFDQTDQVILGFKSIVQDTYSIGLDGVDGLFENQQIYLEDRNLNIIHDLKHSPYSFTSPAGTFNDRFVLRYNNSALGNDTFDTQVAVTAFVQNQELNINSAKNIVEATLYDISGKLIETYKANTAEFKTRFGFAQGVYLVKIKLDNGLEVSKKIIH
ncbi:T9SS type A sorting domain-containing protein [Flavobacterium sp. CYK-4]|uniref:T9SS type A sorting domain-containing protein n=1 Tax=Flavobacterium lotistagni TaxID=2709660 RepID=UPI00140D32FB|nr:T9SS type A sorting domain-containing protein [Flavobacterium lotistagni]NHM06535.1 T9SS type A sorting domain-containing protein [Flavobacterium lotistagni]